MRVYNYTAVLGAGPVFVEVALQPPGTISTFKLHYVVPHDPDVTVLNRFHEVFPLSGGALPASAVLYLRPFTMAPSASMQMRVVQGGTIAPAPGGGSHIVGGQNLGGTLVDTSVPGPGVPLPPAGTVVGPLTSGAQAEVVLYVH